MCLIFYIYIISYKYKFVKYFFIFGWIFFIIVTTYLKKELLKNNDTGHKVLELDEEVGFIIGICKNTVFYPHSIRVEFNTP